MGENSRISAAWHTAFLSPGGAIPGDCSDKEKSYFSAKIIRNLRNGKELAVFLSKTHILFEKKEKTAVQGAENADMKQIDMAESTKCDRIRPDMRSCVHDTDRKQQ